MMASLETDRMVDPTDATSEPACPRDVRRSERGFSFIEVLVVMGIIAVLVGGVVFIVGKWMEDRPRMLTRQRMVKAKVALESLRQRFGSYPAADVRKIETRWASGAGSKIKAPSNRTNLGIEAMVQAMYWPGNEYDPEFNDDEFVNTDEDQLGKAVNNRSNPELLELKDEWDNPLVYIEAATYASAAKDGGVQVLTAEGDMVRAMPYQNEDGSFVAPSSFQLFSIGPDMEPNTEDDVLLWRDD